MTAATVHPADGDILAQACSQAALSQGWAFVAGVLEGAVRLGWSPELTARHLVGGTGDATDSASMTAAPRTR